MAEEREPEVHEFTLQGEIDEETGERKGAKVFQLKEPTNALVNRSLELAKTEQSRGEHVYMHEAQLNQLRLSLIEIDGEPVKFSDLRGDGLDKRLSQKHQNLLMKALEKLTSPDKNEVDAFLATGRKV